MEGIALDINNDIILEDGSFKRVSKGAYVAQKLRSRLRMVQGENENNPDEGIPYYTDIFVKPIDLAAVASIFKSEILDTEGVNSLITFDYEIDNETREYTLDFSVNTDWGEISVSDFTITQGG